MSSLPMPSISPALRETANLKVEEFNRFKDHFTKNIILNLDKAYEQDEPRNVILARLTNLLERVEAYEPRGIVDDDFTMWMRRVEQAQDDKSITSKKLIAMEEAFHHKLEEIANRLNMSEFHIALMEHALQTPDGHADLGSMLDKVALDDEFELIEEEVESVYNTFEEHAFAKRNIDTKAIENYLASLFDDAVGDAQLQRLRRQLTDYGEDLLFDEEKLDEELIEWCLEDLLKNGMLSVKKQTALRGYLQSESAIRELTETLNAMSIRHWDWRNSDKGLPITAQKNAEGKYCITVEEDIIDMLFLHTLAVRWSMELKDGLEALYSTRVGSNEPCSGEYEKREYYLQGPQPPQPTCTTCPHIQFGYPMNPGSQMPQPMCPPPPAMSPPYRPIFKQRRKVALPPVSRFNSRDRKGRRTGRMPLPPSFQYGLGTSVDGERCSIYMQEFFLSRLPQAEGCSAERAIEADTRASLLKMLALEIKTREAFDGSVHGTRANFRSFASSLPHETILAVLGYIGISKEWLGIFKRFLSAPLNIGPLVRGTADQVRSRTSGMPLAHAFETFFGEAVLFCLDLAVHHRTSAEQTTPYLYRLRDECYFVGKQQQCEEVCRQIEMFANVMGLDVSVNDLFPPASCTRAAIGLIAFNRNDAEDEKRPNRVTLAVDNAKVAAFARRVEKQLAACPTVFAWVSTWNRTVGTYAPDLFGPLTNVFGKPHLEAVKSAYNLIHETIFGGDGNLTQHVMDMLPFPLPPGDPTFSHEAWIHLPTAYGGLGVKNPYATLSFARHILTNPDAALQTYLDNERKYYKHTETAFARLTTKQRDDKLQALFNADPDRIAAVFGPDPKTTSTFPTLPNLTAHRERLAPLPKTFPPSNPFAAPTPQLLPSYFPTYDTAPTTSTPPPDLLTTYRLLSAPPPPSHFSASDRILDDVHRLSGRLEMKAWEKMGHAEKWAVGLYGGECFGRFGGLECWWAEGVPRGLVGVLRGESEGESEVRDGDGERGWFGGY